MTSVVTGPLAKRRRPRILNQAVAYWRASTYSGSGALLDLSGRGHDAQLGSTAGADTNDPLWLPYTGTRHVALPGVVGNYLSVPDSVPLSITGDITLEAHVALDDWTPATSMALVAKDGGTRECYFAVTNGGGLRVVLSQDGIATSSYDSTVLISTPDGTPLWVRAGVDHTGARIRFWTSPDGVTWPQFGAQVPITQASQFDGSNPVEIGARAGGTSIPLAGKVYRARIYASDIGSGSGTPVLDIDTSLADPAQTTFLEQSANGAVVTVNRSATGRKTAVVDVPWFLEGTDDYFAVADHADLDFAAADPFTIAWQGRLYGTTATQTLLAKKANVTLPLAGYALHRGADGLTPTLVIADGIATVTATGPALTPGVRSVVAAVRDVVADTVTVYTDGVAGTPVADTTTATLANAEELRLGRLSGAGTNYLDALIGGGAVFRRALSLADVGRLTRELKA